MDSLYCSCTDVSAMFGLSVAVCNLYIHIACTSVQKKVEGGAC